MAHSLVLQVLLLLGAAATTTLAQSVPAMFVFGDSTADVGNNNFIPGQSFKANFAFYGIDFPGGAQATGRFSNGLNGIDYLARMVGFAQSPPPVLSIRDNRQILRGVSFASGGSGILDITGQNKSISLTAQVDFMRRTVDILSSMMGRDDADALVARSLYVFSTGNNDLFDYFRQFGPSPARPVASNSTLKDQFVQLLSTTFRHRVQALYSMGARRFVVIGTAPLGCLPTFRALTPNGDCVDDLNDMSQRLNRAVLAELRSLGSRLEGMRLSFVDVYRVLSNAIARPDSIGYTEIRQACCGSGRLNANEGCNPSAGFVCSDRDRWMFWDRVHPTQFTHWVVAQNAFSGDNSAAMPVNVQQLIRA